MVPNAVSTPVTPFKAVVWDVTYACPLRCEHCYSESGRRATRQLDLDGMLAVADAIIAMGPKLVSLAGGEPLIVPNIVTVARRFANAGVAVSITTSGWPLRPELISELAAVCRRVDVSVDGTTAAVHDRMRGRAGSFDRAMNALTMLEEAAATEDTASVPFGISATITRSSFAQLSEFATVLVPRFPHLRALSIDAVIPAGAGSRPEFVEHEVLFEDQMTRFASAEFAEELRALLPSTVRLDLQDNVPFRMTPDQLAEGPVYEVMFVEPDGDVRAMPIYEGTIGNLRTEPGALLWQRCIDRRTDPFVTDVLAPVRTMRDWAAAIREIDHHFGTEQVRARIERRPQFALQPARG